MKKDNKLFYASLKYGLIAGVIVTLCFTIFDYYNDQRIYFGTVLFYFLIYSAIMGIGHRLATFTGK